MRKTNKEIKEAIFKELQEVRGMEVVNSSVGDGYYLFDLGEESVVHFHIKGCKRWLWGMWITHNDKENKTHIDLFGEHEDYIDKFKPTRTPIAVEIDVPDDATEEQWKEAIDNIVWDLCYQKVFIIKASNVAGKIKFYYNAASREPKGVIRWLLSQWWFYRVKNPFRKWLKYKGNRYVCMLICFILNLFYGRRLHADYKKVDFFHPTYEVYVKYKEGVDDDMIWDVYKHICGNVGFDKAIWVDHIPYGEKRGICFRTKEMD